MRSSFDNLLDRPVPGARRFDWEKALILALIVVALVTRLWGLGIRTQSHDESLHTKYSWNLYAGQGFQHTPLMHGPLLFHGTALSYFLFGDTDFTARLFVALMGVAVVGFPYLFRRWLGRFGAICASFLLLISPSIAYYSRYIRHDLPVILWALVVVLAVFSYLRDGRDRWLYVMAAGVSLSFATKEVAFIYNAIVGFFLIGVFGRRALQRPWGEREGLKSLLGIVLVVLAVGFLVLGLAVLSQGTPAEGTAEGLPWWGTVGAAITAAGLLGGVGLVVVGVWPELHTYRSFDLTILLGTLCLPFLSPLLITLVGLDPVDYTAPNIYTSGGITAAVLGASAAIGLWWSWRRWSIAAGIHYAIFLVLFTTIFTNGSGIASGMVGSMGYWLAQQGVKRGDQPWYYYGVVLPLYDYLPLFLTLVTGGYVAFKGAFSNRRVPPHSERQGVQFLGLERLFVVFLIWWILFAWIAYSYAGEKMPWLTVHLALPMILFGGWGLGRFLERTNWHQIIRGRIWLLALLAPPFVMALGSLASAARTGPFRGSQLAQLNTTGQFLGSLLAVVGFGAALIHVSRRVDWRLASRFLLASALVVPLLLTVRHAWRFCYINFGYPIEHLVYAHSAPAVKNTMRQIDELSRRTVGGPGLIEVAYGADGSWPFHWYLRNYDSATFYGEDPSRDQVDAPVVIAGRDQWDTVAPYMANDYIVNTYTFLWWPMEDYKDLTWQRIWSAVKDPEMRAALWNIWYDRDYALYDQVTGKTHELNAWPLRSEYRLYVRRDTVAKMWDRGTLGPEALVDAEPYGNHIEVTARETFGVQGSGRGEMQNPRGIAVDEDGLIYVADSGNHRIQVFSPDGEPMEIWGGRSIAEEETGSVRGYNEPWGVTMGGQGRAYVADTWNHRVQQVDLEGTFLGTWGRFGESSPDDAELGEGLFYGPRALAVGPVDDSGDRLIYVADTGNKRIQVFRPDGEFVFQWGGGGSAEGYLDEPVGISFGPEGHLYVADTWNRRIQVFDSAGTYLREWPILGWDAGLPDEKPYVAVDAAGHVYVTDPGYYRILVFDKDGNYLLSFGEYGTDMQSFSLPQGIAVSADGSVYVTDAHAHRVVVFDPINFETLSD